ncbi:MAG: carbohydrate kinase family protein [Methanomassiliicoccales archaeon]
MDVVGVGALNLDLIYRVDPLPRGMDPGEERFGDPEDFRELLEHLEAHGELLGRSGGGSAANALVALSRMGFSTGMLGTVGDDPPGEEVLSSLRGVDVGMVRRTDGTGMCISLLSRDDRSLLVLPNANDLFRVTKEEILYAGKAEVVHLSSFSGENALRSQIELVESLDTSTIVSLDPGELYAQRGGEIAPLLSRAHVVFPSEREVEMLTGATGSEGCRALLDRGPEMVACTRGGEGALVVTLDREMVIPPTRVEPVDCTGAGDVFAASFLAGMLRGWRVEDCGRFACQASARSITAYGRDNYPDEHSLQEFERSMAC